MITVEARLLLGSDDTNGDSGHCSNESWEGHRTVAEVGGGTGMQGTAAEGERKRSGILAKPPLCLNRHFEQPKGPFFCAFSLLLSEFGNFGFLAVHQNFKLHTKNYLL